MPRRLHGLRARGRPGAFRLTLVLLAANSAAGGGGGVSASAAAALAASRPRAPAGDPACWRGAFNYEVCCGPQASGERGNPECFDTVYTFEACCEADGSLSPMAIDCRKRDVELPAGIRCEGTPWVPASQWDEFFHAHQLSLALGTSYKGWPDIPRLAALANASGAARRASEEDCVFGFVGATLHALPNIERRQGPQAMRAAYDDIRRIQSRAAHLEHLDCRWNQMINHAMFAHYSLLTEGDGRLTARCPADAPRVYVYDTGELASRSLSCARIGFWASEVYVDRFLRHSTCRVYDWQEADLFFVPAYLTCWELQEVGTLSPGEKRVAGAELAESVRQLPHWGRRAGLDHVFLFGASAWQLQGWRQLLSSSIILAVESRPIECDDANELCWHCTDCFQPWKDLVVPPVTPLTSTRALLAYSRPVNERTLVMSWHGQHANASDPSVRKAYRVTNETVRLALLELAYLPNVSLGGPVSAYPETLGNSVFCLCPKGASSYTSRVFESLFAGCVPVLLSDDVRLPFGDKVDWSKISLRWPMANVGRDLYDYLRAFIVEQPERLLKMQREVANARCWFDYFGMEGNPAECSPYVAILDSLGDRVRHMPAAVVQPFEQASISKG